MNITLDIRYGGVGSGSRARFELELRSRTVEAHVIMTERQEALRKILREASRKIHEVILEPVERHTQPRAELD